MVRKQKGQLVVTLNFAGEYIMHSRPRKSSGGSSILGRREGGKRRGSDNRGTSHFFWRPHQSYLENRGTAPGPEAVMARTLQPWAKHVATGRGAMPCESEKDHMEWRYSILRSCSFAIRELCPTSEGSRGRGSTPRIRHDSQGWGRNYSLQGTTRL